MAVATLSQEIVELEEIIIALDTAYEAGDDCVHPITGKVISDPEYDKLRKQLQELHPKSSVFKDVTASKLSSSSKKVKHYPPMTSISKAIGSLPERTDLLTDFIGKISAEMKYADTEGELVQAYKRDGVAVAIYYEDGKLVSAGLRPRDGVFGEDVTENIKYVEGVPTELWEHDKDGKRVRFLPVTCAIRGELECKKSVFRKVVDDWENPKFGLDKKPKNPRNYTAGSIRQFSDPTVTKQRKISFTGYSILGWTSKDPEFSTAPYKTEIERAKYSNAKLFVPFVQVRGFRHKDLQALEDLCSQLDYEVDGIVISVNNLEDAEQMGTHGGSATGNPKAKIAWKFAEEEVTVEVRDIVWTPGRSGKLTPVLMFDGVELDGTTVSQCTGHSLGFLDGTSASSPGQIVKWAKVNIIKSGKIIPKVVSIVKPGFGTFTYPKSCPSCNSKLEIRHGDTGKDLVCKNEFCGDRATARIVHYLSTLGVKGIADSIVSTLLSNKLITNISDLYTLTIPELRKVGYTERESSLIIARLFFCDDPAHKTDEELAEFCDLVDDPNSKESTINVSAAKLFAALGIPGAGKTAGQALVAHFGTFEAIQKATLAQLLEVEGLGEISANAIVDFFKEYDQMVVTLLEFIVPQGKKTGKLSGKTFVFSGGFDGGKASWEEKVLNEGAVVSGQVGKNTTFLVVGTDAGSKLKKAEELGVKTLSPAQLEKML